MIKITPAKFRIGEGVFKHTGDYTGPGVVRGLSHNSKGQVRYIVGHQIAGGNGEFLHIYGEGNLRSAIIGPEPSLPATTLVKVVRSITDKGKKK